MAVFHDVDGVTVKNNLTVEGDLSVTGSLSESALALTINANAAAGTNEDPSLILLGGDGGTEIVKSTIKQDSSADLLYIELDGGAAGTTRKSPTLVVGVPGETTVSMDSTIRLEGSSDAGVNRVASIVHLGEERRLTVLASNSLVLSDGTGSRTSTAGAVTHAGVSTYELDASGNITIESSAGALSMGADAVAQPVNIATGAAARVISIGNAASASLALEAGVGALSANSDVSLDVNAPLIDCSTQATTIGMIDNSGVALAIKEGSTNYAIFSTANGVEKIQLVQTVEAGTINEVVSNAGVTIDGVLLKDAGIQGLTLADHVDDAAAATGGIAIGQLYRTASAVKIRVA